MYECENVCRARSTQLGVGVVSSIECATNAIDRQGDLILIWFGLPPFGWDGRMRWWVVVVVVGGSLISTSL